MALIEPTDKELSPSNLVKYAVAIPYAIAPLVYLAYATYMGIPLDMFFWIVALGYSIASAYVIFGKKRVDSALDTARDIGEP